MATTRNPEQKIILCGDFGVGKSSLFRRYMNNTFISSVDRKATLGEFFRYHFDRHLSLNNYDLIAVLL